MKKVNLIMSLRDLTAFKTKDLCTEDKPYYKQFLDAYEKKLLDDSVNATILSENSRLVTPVLIAFAEHQSEIPIPFFVDEMLVTQIKGKYNWLEYAGKDSEEWHFLHDEDRVRLYEALDKAGCLDNLE